MKLVLPLLLCALLSSCVIVPPYFHDGGGRSFEHRGYHEEGYGHWRR